MKGIPFYYEEFDKMFERWNKQVAHDFRVYAGSHTPNRVYLWLEEKKNEGDFPKEIADLMKDFFWEIR